MALHEHFTPDNIKAKLNIPPNLQSAFDRVTTAGMKTMYDPKAQQAMLQHLQGPGDMGTKLGGGIAQILLKMWMQSNKTLPPNVMAPAGIYLIVEAASFLDQSGKFQVSDADIGTAIQTMLQLLMKAFKITPQNAAQAAQQAQGTPASDPASPPPGIIAGAQAQMGV